MSAPVPAFEPVGPAAPAGSRSAGWERALVAALRAWAGESLEAVVLTGSHARGEGVWIGYEGRQWSVSDLDVIAVLRGEGDCDAARARRAREPEAWSADAQGFAAPLEVAFLTREGLAAQSPKPGTLALAAYGRVLWGDARVLTELPRWRPGDIPFDERLGLLENRGFELLAGAAPGESVLERARAHHAMLKVAEDLAGTLALAEGGWPTDARRRHEVAVRAASAAEAWPLPTALAGALSPLPEWVAEADAWRSGKGEIPSATQLAGRWRPLVRAWCGVWLHLVTDRATAGEEPWLLILRTAARDGWLRRWRRSITFHPRWGRAPALAERLRRAPAGFPVRRLAATATVLLFAAAQASGPPSLSAGALRALARLGITRATAWEQAAAGACRVWRSWVAGLAAEAP